MTALRVRLGVLGAEVVLQLRAEAVARCQVSRAFLRHPLDVRRRRNPAQQVVSEQTFLSRTVYHRGRAPRSGQLQFAIGRLGEPAKFFGSEPLHLAFRSVALLNRAQRYFIPDRRTQPLFRRKMPDAMPQSGSVVPLTPIA
jgi:hypothetical protein